MRYETWVAYAEQCDGGTEVVDVRESWEFAWAPGKVRSDSADVLTDLANLPKEAHVGSAALAKLLGVCKKSIERAVRRDELPRPFRMGGKSVWLVRTILDHFQCRQNAALVKQDARKKKLATVGGN